MKRIVFSLFTVLLIAGCGAADTPMPSAPLDAPERVQEVAYMSPNWVRPEHATDMETNSRLGADATLAVAQAVETHGTDNWPAVDADLDAFRSQVDEQMRYFADQLLSHRMVRLLDAHCADACDDLRAKHVRRLIDAGFPDARLLEAEMARTSAAWPRAERRALALQAAANAEAWLEQARLRAPAKAARSCDQDAGCGETADAQQRATEAIAEAAARLAAR